MADFVPPVILTTWFVTIGVVIPAMGQWYVVPMIIMICLVYQLIVWFINWYIGSEISMLGFSNTLVIFIMSIILYVGGVSFVLVYSWEWIGILSFLLISYWQRGDAAGASISAVIYNRFGDFGILLVCYSMESWSLCLIAILSKSAIWIFSHWLPMAIEGPTPVSSLLHSSTIVVASVMLSMILSGNLILGLTAVIIMSLFLPAWFDGNKIIALSTSVHLAVMFLAVSCGIYGLCLIHILTHAFVNASCFVGSGVKIAITGVQEIRLWSIENHMIVISLTFLLLSGVGGSIVYNSKEIIILQIVLVFVVLVGWKYTNVFFSNVGGLNVSVMNMNYSIILLGIISGSGFGGMELLTLMVMLGGLIPVVNSWSSYVVNK